MLAVSAITFIVESFVPGNEARTLVGVLGTPAEYRAMEIKLGLNKPLWDQYAHYIFGLLHGNFGVSAFSGEPVVHLLVQRLPVTLSLVILTTVFCAAVGIFLGTMSAVRGGASGRFVDGVSVLGMALPNFWIALILVVLLAVDVRLFPATGYVGLGASPMRWLGSLVLPVVALGLGPVAIVAKQTRNSMNEALSAEYIRTMRACGLKNRSVVFKHAFRNASIPTITVIGLIFVSLLSGTVFVEYVFALPGLGSLAVQAATQHDVPVIEGVTVMFTLLVIGVNLILDVVYAAIDPRIRVR